MILVAIAALTLGSETIRVEVAPKFMDGVHFACEASFDVVVEDSSYHQGQPVLASGSFSFYFWPDASRLFVGVKLGVSPDGTAWHPPSQAYVVNGYRSNLREQQAQTLAELPGFRLFVYQPDGEQTMMAVARLTTERLLNVAYTIDDGAMPQLFDVHLSEEQAGQWGDCMVALTSRDG